MKYPRPDEIFWTFETARFRVVMSAHECLESPYGNLDDDNAQDVEQGRIAWFDAIVSVWTIDGDEATYLAHDCLGCCAYRSVEEFIVSHRGPNPKHRNCTIMRAERNCERVSICHYFPDMVRQAVGEARKAIYQLNLRYTTLAQSINHS